MLKSEILEALIAQLQSEADALVRAAQAAHAAATHEESRAEDQHDTRGLEASYLAGAQANRAADLQALISVYRMMPLRDFGPRDPIEPGALVELRQEGVGRQATYLLVPRGGGTTLNLGGRTIQVIAPQAPLGEALMGRFQDDEIEVESQTGAGAGSVREYTVVSVR